MPCSDAALPLCRLRASIDKDSLQQQGVSATNPCAFDDQAAKEAETDFRQVGKMSALVAFCRQGGKRAVMARTLGLSAQAKVRGAGPGQGGKG